MRIDRATSDKAAEVEMLGLGLHAGCEAFDRSRKRILAIERVRPQLQFVIDGFGMGEYFGDTPLVSEEGWDEFVRDLPAFGDGLERSRL